MNESILNILNSTYYMSNKLIPFCLTVYQLLNTFPWNKAEPVEQYQHELAIKRCFANTCLKRTATKFFMFGLSFHRCGLRAIQNNHCFILARFVVFFFNVYSRRLQNYYVLFEFWLLSSRPFGKGEYYLKGALNAVERLILFLVKQKNSTKTNQATIIQQQKSCDLCTTTKKAFFLIWLYAKTNLKAKQNMAS